MLLFLESHFYKVEEGNSLLACLLPCILDRQYTQNRKHYSINYNFRIIMNSSSSSSSHILFNNPKEN